MDDPFRRVYGPNKILQEIIFEEEILIYRCFKRLTLKSPHTIKTSVEYGFWAIHDDFFDIHIMEDNLKESLRVYEEYLYTLWLEYTYLRNNEKLPPKEQDLKTKLLSKFKCYDENKLLDFYKKPVALGYKTDASKLDEELVHPANDSEE